MMTQKEFETLLGEKVNGKDYELIEYVYLWYPKLSKVKIAIIYKIGGMLMIDDLLPRAQAVKREMEETGRKINLL